MSNLRRFENPTEGQPAPPARPVPTAPGWWYIKADPRYSDTGEPFDIVRVLQGASRLLVSGMSPAGVDERHDIEWLAPIPRPAILAAFEAWRQTVLKEDEDGLMSSLEERGDALWEMTALVLAERDGAP